MIRYNGTDVRSSWTKQLKIKLFAYENTEGWNTVVIFLQL